MPTLICHRGARLFYVMFNIEIRNFKNDITIIIYILKVVSNFWRHVSQVL